MAARESGLSTAGLWLIYNASFKTMHTSLPSLTLFTNCSLYSSAPSTMHSTDGAFRFVFAQIPPADIGIVFTKYNADFLRGES